MTRIVVFIASALFNASTNSLSGRLATPRGRRPCMVSKTRNDGRKV